MFSSFRNRFGIPGVISVIALVFAMFGGAYAASNSGGDDSKASASAKKGKKGPRGPRGPKGPAGSQGPAGPAGSKGDKGDAGSNGANGKDGAPGLKGATGPTGAAGATGATGVTGPDGAEGSPWTAGGTLPSEATLTGAWAFGFEPTGPGILKVPISFPISLAAPLSGSQVHVIEKESDPVPPGCAGGSLANPKAEPGHLCVYGALLDKAAFAGPATFDGFPSIMKASLPGSETGASTTGAVLQFATTEAGAQGHGVFAVTGF